MDRHLPIPPGTEGHDAISTLLASARLSISQGKPSLALQAVIAALKLSGGNEIVLQTLARARDIYQSRVRASADANELATLFAECAIGEADAAVPTDLSSQAMDESLDVPSLSLGLEQAHMLTSSSTGEAAPILAESGRMQVVLDASADGSSFICLQCGGLVSGHRKDEHIAYWCSHSRQVV
ncbi:hypothetical protein GOP47_0001162 [Adiantum capillus-veneris]|uniref:C2HC zinc finger plants domain-containing protein n=1 Tax=Adiantum capillus-veneris TaxID=13818 RepID=A0A9D4VGC6_ADICA|nr:hypothetical protein GOP47_0001162 [Adiantum capillus-veneris]